MDLISELRRVKDLSDLPEDQLHWLVEYGEIQTFEQGEYIFSAGDPMNHLIILLKGKCLVKLKQGGQFRLVTNLGPYAIGGLLPYSRAEKAKGYGEIIEDATILYVHKKHFRYMASHFEELTSCLVHLMSSRIR